MITTYNRRSSKCSRKGILLELKENICEITNITGVIISCKKITDDTVPCTLLALLPTLKREYIDVSTRSYHQRDSFHLATFDLLKFSANYSIYYKEDTSEVSNLKASTKIDDFKYSRQGSLLSICQNCSKYLR